jgi:LemA protein
MKVMKEAKQFYTKPWFWVLVVLVVIVFWLWGTYNSLVTLSMNVDNKWAQVETQYQRRYDLIPRLVNTTSAYAQFEKSTLTEITQLRSQWAAAPTPEEKIGVANQWDSAISRLLLVFENYPQLKTVEPLRALQDELAGTENRIAVARMDYNNVVRDYNTAIKLFPANLIAGYFGFKVKTYFESVSGAENAPGVPGTLGT